MQKAVIALGLLFAVGNLARAQARLPTASFTTYSKEEQELLTLSKTKWAWMADKNDSREGSSWKLGLLTFSHLARPLRLATAPTQPAQQH